MTDEELKAKIDKNLPEIKRERIPGSKRVEEFTENINGKEVPMKKKSYVEKEIDNVHLVKIAPMFYYCTDNNRILMIPFSIQFSVVEFLQLAASMATNLEERIAGLRTDRKPEKNSSSGDAATPTQPEESPEGDQT